MLDIFDKMIMETEIDFLEANADLTQLNYAMICEAAGEKGKSKSVVTRIVNKIREIIGKVLAKIRDFFGSAIYEKQMKEAEAAIKEDPTLANQKIEVRNFQKVEKLKDDTFKKITSTDASVEKTMKKYRQQRNVLLAAAGAAALVIVSAVVHLKNMRIARRNAEYRLKKTEIEAAKALDLMFDMMCDKGEELERTKKKLQNYTESGSDTSNRSEYNERANAVLELARDSATDTLASIKEMSSKLNFSKKSE